MILYAATDLLWATRIKSTAEDLGIPARPVRNAQMLADRLADCDVRALIVDLTMGELAIELISAAPLPGDPRLEGRRFRVLAFGPHLEKELLQEARDVGADEVLPRGAFDRNLPDILLKLGAQGEK